MKKLVMLVAALMAVAFVGLNYESTAYANDRAIPSIGVSGGTDSISVVWTTPTEAPHDYRLAWGLNGGYISYKASNTSTAGNAYPGGSVTSYTITGLDPGTYSVKLRARYDGSAGLWKSASSVVVTGDAPPVVVVPDPTAEPEPPTSEQQQADPPAAPTGLTASQVAHDSVTLTWTAPSSVSTVTGYKVLRGTDANSLSAIAQDTGSAGAEYTDSTVAAETTYHYAVLALSADGDGAQSNTASATTPAPPKKRGDNRVSPRQTVPTSITLVSNTGQTSGGVGSLGSHDQAQAFTTGDNSAGYTLTSVLVVFQLLGTASTNYVVSIRNDSSGAPGTLVGALMGPATLTTRSTFTASGSGLTLSADTTYFFMIDSSAGDENKTQNTTSDNEDTGAQSGWSIADGSLYRDRATTGAWTAFGESKKIEIKGTAIPDTTAPAFASAAANGTSLVITFDEDLAAAASLANGAFPVKKTPSGGSEATVTLSTTTGPAISGKTVTLTLGTALVSTDGSVKVSYTKPTSGTANKLVDAAANETATFPDQPVTNNTPAAQTVTTFISNTGQTDSITGGLVSNTKYFAQQFMTGSNTGGYSLSAIVVEIHTGSAATPAFALHQSTTVSGVEVPGTKVVNLTGSITTAGEQSFTPDTTTTLSASTKYFVVLHTVSSSVLLQRTNSDDEDSGGSTGWEIADNYVVSLNSGSTWLTSLESVEIAVKGTAVATDATAPAFASAAANGASLVITFDEDLAAAASLANGAFTVEKTPSGGSEATVTLSTTSGPVISGKTVTLTLATALVSTDTAVKVSYTKPATGTANKLVDAAANATATFTDQPVTNNTPAAQVVSIEAVHPKASPFLADVEFRVTRAPVMTTPLTVTLSITQTVRYLFNTAPTITIPANQTSAVGKYNSSYNGTTSGTVTATVVAGTGYAPATAPANAATVTFAAHPRPLTMGWASDTYTVSEGDTLSAGVTLRTRDGAPKPRDNYSIGFNPLSGTALPSTLTVTNDYVHKSVRAVVEPAAWSADGMAFVATALVTVATVEDSVDEDDEQFSIQTDRSSNDAVYDRTCTAAHHVGIVDCRTFVTITDDDTRGVTLSAATLTVNEGSTGAYTVKLDSEPTAPVTVTPAKTGSGDVTFAPASLTFLTSNWSATQTVTVTAAQDTDAVDDNATISHTVSGGDYGSVTAASVVVTVDDDETTDSTAPAFESAAANGASLVITFDEDLAAAASLANSAFTVKKTPSGGSEATVTLSATVAPVISGKTVTLTLASALVSTDGSIKVSYTKPTTGTANKLVDAAANETATFTDQTVTNNTPALPVITIAAGTSPVTEGTAAAFTLTRTGSATAELSVNVTVSESGDMVTSINEGAKTATFEVNSATAALSVATVGDTVDEADSVVTVTVDTATPATYTVGTSSSATVTVGDNDLPEITILAGTSPVTEGTTLTFELSRTWAAPATLMVSVTVAEVAHDVNPPGDMIAATNEGTGFVTFLANSATATLSVPTVDDADPEIDSRVEARIEAAAGRYRLGRPSRGQVIVRNNDVRGVTLSMSALTVGEGVTGAYTVRLNTRPTGNVTVTPRIATGSSSDVTFSPTNLTFRRNNWNTPQTVTVAAAQDSDAVDDSATIAHTVAGADYGTHSVSAGPVTVTVRDDETGGNNLPTSRSGTVTATEDTAFTLSESNFAFSDGDSGDTLASVKITELPAAGKGTLALDGTAITSSALPKTVTKAELDASKLKYTPPANGYGTAYTSFKFKVNDGTADSAAAYTMTINVTNVNDPATGRPTLSGGTTVGSVLTASIGGISDPDGVPSSISYQWKRFAANGTTFEANIGTNSNRYTLAEGDAGKTVRVEVSFTDNGGTREGPLLSAATATVQRPSSGSLSVGPLGAYWHDNHDNGGNLLRVDSCSGVKRFRVIWAGPEGNRRADEWDAEITDRGGARTLSPSFRETPGSPGNFEMTGTVNFTGPGIVSVRVQGRFGSTWGTWSPTATLHCVEKLA